MPTIQAFRGWRYDPGKVDPARVATPPYDVIDPELQEELYRRDEHNAVRLLFGRTAETDTDQDNRYTRAAACLDAWREAGVFLQDRPSVYVYEQVFPIPEGPRTRRGFFARVLLAPWGEAGVYPHERTLAGPKEDRLRLLRAVRGNTGPVFGLAQDDDGELRTRLAELAPYDPACDFTDAEGVRHRLWVADHEERIRPMLDASCGRPVFIADGHHRYETALAYRDEVRQALRDAGRTPPPLGELDSDYVLMLIVPDSDEGLVIWPTHRVVHDVPDFSPDALMEGLKAHFDLAPAGDEHAAVAAVEAAEAPAFAAVLPDRIETAVLRDPASMEERAGDKPEAWRALDVSALHLLVLEGLLGIDAEKLLRKENVYYARQLDEAMRMVRDGEGGAQAGFLMRGTPMAQVRDVARAGEVMPQKSTYFYPKVLSGLVFHFFW